MKKSFSLEDYIIIKEGNKVRTLKQKFTSKYENDFLLNENLFLKRVSAIFDKLVKNNIVDLLVTKLKKFIKNVDYELNISFPKPRKGIERVVMIVRKIILNQNIYYAYQVGVDSDDFSEVKNREELNFIRSRPLLDKKIYFEDYKNQQKYSLKCLDNEEVRNFISNLSRATTPNRNFFKKIVKNIDLLFLFFEEVYESLEKMEAYCSKKGLQVPNFYKEVPSDFLQKFFEIKKFDFEKNITLVTENGICRVENA